MLIVELPSTVQCSRGRVPEGLPDCPYSAHPRSYGDDDESVPCLSTLLDHHIIVGVPHEPPFPSHTLSSTEQDRCCTPVQHHSASKRLILQPLKYDNHELITGFHRIFPLNSVRPRRRNRANSFQST